MSWLQFKFDPFHLRTTIHVKGVHFTVTGWQFELVMIELHSTLHACVPIARRARRTLSLFLSFIRPLQPFRLVGRCNRTELRP